MALPSFLCVGAQKSGTTTLYALLRQHSHIYLPDTKEIHYFTLNYANNHSWYEHHFLDASVEQICGDITPYYLFHPFAPERAFSLIPDARIVVLLRDPVDRAISQYFHSVRLGLETLDMKTAFELEEIRLHSCETVLRYKAGLHSSHQEHSYLSRSKYEIQLARWLKYYNSEQILLLRSEEFFSDLEISMQKIFTFLSLPPQSCEITPVHLNAGKSECNSVPSSFRQKLRMQLSNTYDWLSDNDLAYDNLW